MTNSLQIISSRLLDAFVRRDRGVPCCACQIFAIFIRNVLALAVLVAFCETKVNDVNIVACCVLATDQKIVRLYVAMNDPLFVYFLNSSYKLICNH